jgi:PAS domain S-box-containing protein
MDPRPEGTKEETERQEDSLQLRLSEAEATLDAIRSGAVDALVISSPHGEEVIRSIMDMGSLGDSLFNQVAQPIFIIDESYRIIRSNKSAQELCDGNPVGTLFSDALQLRPAMAEEGSQSADFMGDWIRQPRHISALDVFHDHPVLGRRFYLLDANPVMLSWEGLQGGIITLLDITERKLAEIHMTVKSGQLRRQFNLMKSISDNIAEGLLLLDEDQRLVFQNPAAMRLLGLTESELPGRDLGEIFRVETEAGERIDISRMQADARDKGDAATQRGILLGWDGKRRPIQYSYYPVKDFDDSRSSILVLSDISDRLSSEKQLLLSMEKQQQSQKMEAIGRLAGGIAHDFNNLLLVIMGFTDLALMELHPETHLHGNLMEVKKAGEKAASLTSQLLAYSRKQVLAPNIRPINGVITDLQKMVSRLLDENIRVQIELSPENLRAEIDPAKLQQVLVNLILNARDSMPRGGLLWIRSGRMEVESRDISGMVGEIRKESGDGLPPGSYAYLEIEDTGHGMDESTLGRLFEPFFTTKEFGKGSGLGLSTAYGIVRQLGGFFQVFSTIGKGSTFKVILPLADANAKARPETPGLPGTRPLNGKGKRVMLVEDEEVVRRFLAKILKENGYNVIEASNGEDALAKLPPSGSQLDLVVTDLIMNGMGGVELAGELSRLRPEVEILFISGYAEDQHKLPLVAGSNPHFAAKPFSADEFLAKIRDILEGKTRPKSVLSE